LIALLSCFFFASTTGVPMGWLRARAARFAVWLTLTLSVPSASRASWAPDGNLIVPESRLPSLQLPIGTSGGVYVEWLDGGSGYNFDLRLSRWTTRGNVADGWTQIINGNMITNLGYRKYDPCATSDGAGNALFAWSDDRSHTY